MENQKGYITSTSSFRSAEVASKGKEPNKARICKTNTYSISTTRFITIKIKQQGKAVKPVVTLKPETKK